MEVRTWFAKGRGKIDGKQVISSQYFIKNNCLSCGWGIEDVHSFYEYKEKFTIQPYVIQENKKWGNQSVHHLFETLKKGDYVWTRLDGIYYVAVIPDDPINLFHYDDSNEAKLFDCVIQLRDIYWKEVGTEDKVPGSVSTFSSNRNALIRIDNRERVIKGSKYRPSSLISADLYGAESNVLINDKNEIFNLISYSGLEDIIALWLFDKFKYVVIPSTSKISTQKYEFVLVDTTKENDQYLSSKRIYVQTKNGNNDLYINDYKEINNSEYEIWLVTTKGKITLSNGLIVKDKIVRYNNNTKPLETLYDLEELVSFIFDDKKRNIFPEYINEYLKYFKV